MCMIDSNRLSYRHWNQFAFIRVSFRMHIEMNIWIFMYMYNILTHKKNRKEKCFFFYFSQAIIKKDKEYISTVHCNCTWFTRNACGLVYNCRSYTMVFIRIFYSRFIFDACLDKISNHILPVVWVWINKFVLHQQCVLKQTLIVVKLDFKSEFVVSWEWGSSM